jgi:hypothetical protein
MNANMDSARLLMANADNESQSIHIESDVLDPATSITEPNGETVFNIRKKGIIDKGSQLVFSVLGKDANQRLTLAGGAFAMIQRATLRTSKGVVICQSDKLNHFASLRLKFIDQEIREKKLVVKTGTYECYESATINGIEGQLRPKGDYDTGAGDAPIQYRLGNTDKIEYQISLAEMFPEAVNYQIPVYLIDGNLQLVITWALQAERSTAVTGAKANITGVDITDVKYISDHLFFDGRTMGMMREQAASKGLVLPYNDFNTVEFQLISPGNPAAGNSLEKEFRQFMGLSNMTLKYMILQTQERTADGLPADATNADSPGMMINGFYESRGSFKGGSDSDRTGGDQINVIINNKQYYPIDWNSDNLLYTELEDVYKRPYAVPRQAYTSSGGVVDQTLVDANGALNLNEVSENNVFTSGDTYFGEDIEGLTAVNHYMGINFSTVTGPVPNSGLKVGFSPIEFKLIRTFTNQNSENLLLRAFCCVERMMVIKNGEVAVTYS